MLWRTVARFSGLVGAASDELPCRSAYPPITDSIAAAARISGLCHKRKSTVRTDDAFGRTLKFGALASES